MRASIVWVCVCFVYVCSAQLQSGNVFPNGIRVSESSSAVNCTTESAGLLAFDGEQITVCVSSEGSSEFRVVPSGQMEGCAAGEVLTLSSGGVYECVHVSVNVSLPQCGSNEVLTVAEGSNVLSCTTIRSLTVSASLTECYNGIDPCTADTVGFWRFDESSGSGAFLKDSCGDWDAEPVGAAAVSAGYDGNGWSTPGTAAGYIRIEDNPSVVLDTAFTVELYVKVHSTPACNWGGMVSRWDYTVDKRHFSLTTHCTGGLYLYVSATGNSYARIATVDNYVPEGVWMHLVGTYHGPTAQLQLFRDGVLVPTTVTNTIPTSIYAGANIEYAIGFLQSIGGTNIDGPLHATYDNLRIRSTATQPFQFIDSLDSSLCSPLQSDSTVLLKELENISPPTVQKYSQLYARKRTVQEGNVEGTALLLTANDEPVGYGLLNTALRDDSPANHQVSVAEFGDGGVRITGDAIVGNGALEVRSTSKIRITDNVWQFYQGDVDFTIEFFYRQRSQSSESTGVYSLGYENGEGNMYETLLLYRSGFPGTLYMYSSSSGTSWNVFSAVTVGALELDVWHHYAVSKQGTTYRTFRDGVLQSTATQSSMPRNTTGRADAQLELMGRPSNPDRPLSGDLDEIRVSRGVARYTANFSPPTGPLPADSFTVLSLHFDLDVFDASNGHAYYGVGNVSTSTGENVYSAGGAYAFDGSTSYLSVLGSGTSAERDTDFDFGMDEFTMEMWIRADSYDQDAALVSGRSFDEFDGLLWKLDSRVSTVSMSTSGAGWEISLQSPAIFADGEWIHLAVVRRLTTVSPSVEVSIISQFLHGSGVAETQISSTSGIHMPSGGGLRIGADFYGSVRQCHFQGIIDDLRIVRGAPLYISNFAPPTPFSGTSQSPSLHFLGSDGTEFEITATSSRKLQTPADSTEQWSSVGETLSWNGRVAIGLPRFEDVLAFDAAANHSLTVNGTIESTGVFLSSDSRLKTDISPLDGALETVEKLHGRSYYWKNAKHTEEHEHTVRSQETDEEHSTPPYGEADVGFIAQEVEEVLPALVRTGRGGYKAVAYDKVVPLLVEAVKELKGLVSSQEVQLRELRETVRQLEEKC